MIIQPTRTVLGVLAFFILLSLNVLHSLLELVPQTPDAAPEGFMNVLESDTNFRGANQNASHGEILVNKDIISDPVLPTANPNLANKYKDSLKEFNLLNNLNNPPSPPPEPEHYKFALNKDGIVTMKQLQEEYDSFCYECLHSRLYSAKSAPIKGPFCPMIPSLKHDNGQMVTPAKWVPCQPYQMNTIYENGVLDLGSLEFAGVSTVDKNQFREDGFTKNKILDPNWQTKSGKVKVVSELVRVLLPNGVEELHLQVIENKTSHERARKISKEVYGDKKPLNIVMLVLDTIPRPYLATYFPKTVSWLKSLNSRNSSQWRAFTFDRYNSQPGSTSPNMTPVLCGKAFPGTMEPDRVKTLHWTNPPGVVPGDWFQAHLQKNGYVTMFGSPTSNLWMGTAWWDSSGFDHIPPVYVSVSNYRHSLIKLSAGTGYCINGRQCHQVTFDYTHSMWEVYQDVPKFSYIHFHEGHDNQATAGVMDADIPAYIEKMMSENNTIVYFMSDHGAKDVHNRPFLNIIVPVWWMKQNNLESTLFHNQEQLFSAYDLHKTLRHTISIPDLPPVPEAWSNHYPSISLFEAPIPWNRSCVTARIPPNHCFCEPWREPWEVKKKVDDPSYRWLVDLLMRTINKEPGINAGLCPKFTFSSVDLVAWKEPVEEKGVRYWMVEVTMKEGHPHRYSMNVKELLESSESTSEEKITVMALKQITRYFPYEKCTPQGASPEFCVCNREE